MFNYKRMSFILLILAIYLILTETSFEKRIRASSWDLINVAVDEGGEVGEKAPMSFLETIESGRIGTKDFLLINQDRLDRINSGSSGIKYIALSVASVILGVFAYLCSFIITFYPIMALIIYQILTSRFFKKDEFEL